MRPGTPVTAPSARAARSRSIPSTPASAITASALDVEAAGQLQVDTAGPAAGRDREGGAIGARLHVSCPHIGLVVAPVGRHPPTGDGVEVGDRWVVGVEDRLRDLWKSMAFAARYFSQEPWNSRCSLVTLVKIPMSKSTFRVRAWARPARRLHHEAVVAGRHHVGQQRLQLQRLRCRCGSHLAIARRRCRPLPSRPARRQPAHRVRQEGGGGLAIGAGDADHVQAPRRMAVPGIGRVGVARARTTSCGT